MIYRDQESNDESDIMPRWGERGTNLVVFRGYGGVVNDYDDRKGRLGATCRTSSQPPLQVTIARVNDRRVLQACSSREDVRRTARLETERDEMSRDQTRRDETR